MRACVRLDLVNVESPTGRKLYELRCLAELQLRTPQQRRVRTPSGGETAKGFPSPSPFFFRKVRAPRGADRGRPRRCSRAPARRRRARRDAASPRLLCRRTPLSVRPRHYRWHPPRSGAPAPRPRRPPRRRCRTLRGCRSSRRRRSRAPSPVRRIPRSRSATARRAVSCTGTTPTRKERHHEHRRARNVRQSVIGVHRPRSCRRRNHRLDARLIELQPPLGRHRRADVAVAADASARERLRGLVVKV